MLQSTAVSLSTNLQDVMKRSLPGVSDHRLSNITSQPYSYFRPSDCLESMCTPGSSTSFHCCCSIKVANATNYIS
jgi:hypothetical protein